MQVPRKLSNEAAAAAYAGKSNPNAKGGVVDNAAAPANVPRFQLAHPSIPAEDGAGAPTIHHHKAAGYRGDDEILRPSSPSCSTLPINCDGACTQPSSNKSVANVRAGETNCGAFSPQQQEKTDVADAPFQKFALCHREREALLLKQALDRGCCIEPPESVASANSSIGGVGNAGELVLVTGPSGCGKTCLVESVVRSALSGSSSGASADSESSGRSDAPGSRRGVLICGKFDQLERREQYYAIVQALTEYALILSRESSASQLQSVRAALASHRDTVRIVADLAPGLLALLSKDHGGAISNDEEGANRREDQRHQHPPQEEKHGCCDPSNDVWSHGMPASSPDGGAVARERLQLGLRRFFSAVCSPTSPVVLFLDDLQWAEPASLDLLASLFTDRIPGLVVIGACRDNEVDPSSYLCVILRELEALNVTITQLVVNNVGQPSLRSALLGSNGMGGDEATVLAKVLFGHTQGNMFFVTQLVRYLVTEGVLYKPKQSGCWTFDSEHRLRDAIRDAQDKVSLLAIVIQKQERQVQDTLMVASCLGAEFSELVLRAAVSYDVTESLQVAERMAFLKRSAHDRGSWRFVHDRIQESAYSLIPSHEREQVHIRIGRNLWKSLTQKDMDVFAHVVLKQLRLGLDLIIDPAERELVAALLLWAGEMSARALAFVTAQEYLYLGIKLLHTRHWRDQYPLSLSLYNAAAEIEYCLSNFERMDALIVEIMEHARSTKDKIRAQTARIYALGSRKELDEAIDVGLATLRDFFGERLPSRPSASSIMLELRKTRGLLRGQSVDSLMSLPIMVDSQAFASVRIMSLLLLYVGMCRPKLSPILAMRIVQHSIRQGLCSMSSNGFVCFGLVLAKFCNDVETGIQYGTVALRIVERFNAMDQHARVSTVAHCFCLAYTERLPTLLQPLRLAHRMGLGSGDIQHSLMAAGMFTMVCVHSFRPLSGLSSDVSSFLALTASYRHSGTDLLFRPMAQLIECLRGEVADPSKLQGSYLDWEPALRLARETNHVAAVSVILKCKLILQSLFRRMEDAEASANELSLRGSGMEMAPCFMKATFLLHQGLAHLGQAHKDGILNWRRVRRARQCHKKLVHLSKFSDLNYGSKALLLGAELLAASGGRASSQALLQYEDAVALARKAEAWGDAALACERLSSALMAKGRSDESLLYLNQAARYYEQWGATAKVAELQAAILQKRGLVPSRAGRR